MSFDRFFGDGKPHLIFVAVAILWLWRLDEPKKYVFDETYYSFTARRYALGDPNAWKARATRADVLRFDASDVTITSRYQWTHPPFSTLIMAATVRLFGWHPYVPRLGSICFGLIALGFTWALARRIRPGWFANIVLVLLAADGTILVLSRTAMATIYVVACSTAAVFFFYRFWTSESARVRWLLATGLSLAVGMAVKWSVIPLALGLGVIAFARILRDSIRSNNFHELWWWFACFLVMPVSFYLLAYAPYFLWWHHSWADFVRLHSEMWWFHHHLPDEHGLSSPWYSWPLMLRPVWFFFVPDASNSAVQVICCVGNPWIWWLSIPSITYVLIRFLRRRLAEDAVILVGFFGLWVPWAFLNRYSYMYYFTAVLPFAALAIAVALEDISRLIRFRWLSGIYVVATLAMFAYQYPLLTGRHLDRSTMSSRLWFDQWRKTQ